MLFIHNVAHTMDIVGKMENKRYEVMGIFLSYRLHDLEWQLGCTCMICAILYGIADIVRWNMVNTDKTGIQLLDEVEHGVSV